MLREEVLMTAPEASVGFVFRFGIDGKGETVSPYWNIFLWLGLTNPKKDRTKLHKGTSDHFEPNLHVLAFQHVIYFFNRV